MRRASAQKRGGREAWMSKVRSMSLMDLSMSLMDRKVRWLYRFEEKCMDKKNVREYLERERKICFGYCQTLDHCHIG